MLSSEAANNLWKRILYPDKETLEKRNNYFKDIEKNVHIIKSDNNNGIAEIDDFDDSFMDEILKLKDKEKE